MFVLLGIVLDWPLTLYLKCEPVALLNFQFTPLYRRNQYFSERILSPFGNYIRERGYKIDMTKFMEKNYQAAADKMKGMLLL